MDQSQTKNYNRLAMQRRKLGYSQRVVAKLLGHKSHASLSTYERGLVLPTLPTALRLEIILGVPIGLLFPTLTSKLEAEVVEVRRQLAALGQQVIFKEY